MFDNLKKWVMMLWDTTLLSLLQGPKAIPYGALDQVGGKNGWKKWSRKTVGQCVSHVNPVLKKFRCHASFQRRLIRWMSGCPCSKEFLLWCGLNKSRLTSVIGELSPKYCMSRNGSKIGQGNVEGQIGDTVGSYGSREIYTFFFFENYSIWMLY